MLRIWNTATKQLEEIKPITPGKIGFYACGPTVYQQAHIGNMRAYVLEDMLRRTLVNLEGFKVKHVMNITDVGHLTDDADEGEDKLEKAAREAGRDAWVISKENAEKFIEDMKALNILEPSSMPKATDHIQEQIELIKALEEKGATYQISDGIYFDTSKVKDYGKLGGQKLEDKKEGARVKANPDKKNATDFALWKFSPKDQTRQMEWDSPWGKGFPGWHVECSAMSRMELGQPIDIHAGGVDHIPIHHENEIAQSETAYGVPYVNHWMHVEFLTVDGQKMSKSLGNAYTIEDLRNRGIDPMALRYFFLGAQYRSKQNFTWDAIQGAQITLEKIQRTVRSWEKPKIGCAEFEKEFKMVMEDDLNTPEALAILWKVMDSKYPTSAKAKTVLFIDKVLGLGLDEVVAKPLMIPVDIKKIADERWDARKIGDWDTSDRLREELQGNGWTVLDGKDGYTLENK